MRPPFKKTLYADERHPARDTLPVNHWIPFLLPGKVKVSCLGESTRTEPRMQLEWSEDGCEIEGIRVSKIQDGKDKNGRMANPDCFPEVI